MTTTITIRPAGHRIQLTKEHLDATGAVAREEKSFIEAGGATETVYIHSGMSVRIAETDPRKPEELAEKGTAERNQQDVENYRAGKPTS